MSDITGLVHNHMAGANSTLAKAAGARPAPEPPTVQNAVSQPLNTAQSAVTQPPTSGHTGWKREADADGGQHALSAGASATHRQLANTVDQLNRHMRAYNTNLQFVMDDNYQQVVIRIVDRDTQEVVKQIPTEATLALAKFFDDLFEQQIKPVLSGTSDSSVEW